MSRHHGPSDREPTLPFGTPSDWTPQQAFAVVEMLDKLRELIYATSATDSGPLRADRHLLFANHATTIRHSDEGYPAHTSREPHIFSLSGDA